MDSTAAYHRLATVWLGLCLALMVLAGPAMAERRVELYEPRSRLAEELLPIAEAAMAGEGEASLAPGANALLLVGEAAAVDRARELLARQDRAPRSVVLHYQTKRASELASLGLELRWTVEAGDFRIGNLRVPPGAGSSVTARAEEAMRRLSSSLTGTLRVSEGSRARVETGTSIPFPASDGVGGTTTELATAGTGYEAAARILGDGRVQVDLSAFAGQLAREGRILKLSASAPVVVTPGQTLVVGGLGPQQQESRSMSLRGVRADTVQDDTLLLLRAEIE
jgi:type II secretory pathway component GspD/PulD (secretin)